MRTLDEDAVEVVNTLHESRNRWRGFGLDLLTIVLCIENADADLRDLGADIVNELRLETVDPPVVGLAAARVEIDPAKDPEMPLSNAWIDQQKYLQTFGADADRRRDPEEEEAACPFGCQDDTHSELEALPVTDGSPTFATKEEKADTPP